MDEKVDTVILLHTKKKKSYLIIKDKNYLRVKDAKEIFQANRSKKQAGVAILISNKIDF